MLPHSPKIEVAAFWEAWVSEQGHFWVWMQVPCVGHSEGGIPSCPWTTGLEGTRCEAAGRLGQEAGKLPPGQEPGRMLQPTGSSLGPGEQGAE